MLAVTPLAEAVDDGSSFAPPSIAAGILDVNRDGMVSSVDGLRVINHLIEHGVTAVEASTESARLDVNGDYLVSASDALAVINALIEHPVATPMLDVASPPPGAITQAEDIAIETNVLSSVSRRILTVQGTSFDDTIELRMFGLQVWVNSATRDSGRFLSEDFARFDVASIDRIEVYSQTGNDLISVSFPSTLTQLAVTLDGGDGDDTIQAVQAFATMIGGQGNDNLSGRGGLVTLDYLSSPQGIDVDLLRNVAASDGFGTSDSLRGIRNVLGSNLSDVIRGDRQANHLLGRSGIDYLDGDAGDDELEGGADNDSLRGGLGNDLFDGGPGDDEADFSHAVAIEGAQDATGVVVDLVNGTAHNEGSDTLVSIEVVNGSDGRDHFNLSGSAKVRGGPGIDTYVINGVTVNLHEGADERVPLAAVPQITDLWEETFDRFRDSYLTNVINNAAVSGANRDAANAALFTFFDKYGSSGEVQNGGFGLWDPTGGAASGAWNNTVGGAKKIWDDGVSSVGSLGQSWVNKFGDTAGRVLSNIGEDASNAVIYFAEGVGQSAANFVERLGNLGNPLTLKFYERFLSAVGLFVRDLVGTTLSAVGGFVIDVLGDLLGELFGRNLTQAEKDVAHKVFGGKLKTWQVRVIDGGNPINDLLRIGRPYTNGHTINLDPKLTMTAEERSLTSMKVRDPLQPRDDPNRELGDPPTDDFNVVGTYGIDHGTLGPLVIGTFVHELVHVLQKQETESPTSQKIREFVNQDDVDPKDLRHTSDHNYLGGPLLAKNPAYRVQLDGNSTWDGLASRPEPQAVVVEDFFIFLELTKAIESAAQRAKTNGTTLREEILRINPNTVPKDAWDTIYSDVADIMSTIADGAQSPIIGDVTSVTGEHPVLAPIFNDGTGAFLQQYTIAHSPSAVATLQVSVVFANGASYTVSKLDVASPEIKMTGTPPVTLAAASFEGADRKLSLTWSADPGATTVNVNYEYLGFLRPALDSNQKYLGFPSNEQSATLLYPGWKDHFRIMISQGLFGFVESDHRSLTPFTWSQQTRG